ncbi:AEX-3 domain-containing protein [Lipomyces arxii]|uniref:AEX-3 domain-containing protein n=1 Tax=Lipomyces arxii TaxID=56418 RepID=UPI0034CDFDA5
MSVVSGTQNYPIADFFFIAGIDQAGLEAFVRQDQGVNDKDDQSTQIAVNEVNRGNTVIRRKVTLENVAEDGEVTLVNTSFDHNELTTLHKVNALRLKEATPHSKKRLYGQVRRVSNYGSVVSVPASISWPENVHPLDRKLDPVLLDVYPRDQEIQANRGRLPEHVPMFAFPDDVQIQYAESRPISTWHHFIMTNENDEKRYGTCVTIWIPLPTDTATAAEQLSEQWCENHVISSDLEVAADLNEKLVSHKARLSQLLTEILTISDEDKKERLKDEIAATEEYIGMTSDILQSLHPRVRHAVSGSDKRVLMWMPRTYGLLSRDENTLSFRLEWLKVLLYGEVCVREQPGWSGQRVPMEFAIAQLLKEQYILNSGYQLKVNMGNVTLYARHHAANELPGSRDTDLYGLFRCLSVRSIVELLEAVLAECRIILVSSDLAMLTCAARAIVSLIYPLKWQSPLIPVLPTRLRACLEMPVPYIIGLHRTGSELLLPDEDYVLCDLDGDAVVSSSTPPLLPASVRNKLFALLELSAPLHNPPFSIAHGTPRYISEAFPEDAHIIADVDIMTLNPSQQRLDKLVGESSAAYLSTDRSAKPSAPILNVPEFSVRARLSANPLPTRNANGARKTISVAMSFRNFAVINPDEGVDLHSSHSSQSSVLMPDDSVPTTKVDIPTTEGHIFQALQPQDNLRCIVCLDGIAASTIAVCRECGLEVHKCCLRTVVLPCLPMVFHASRARAAFVRSMATLFFNYRRFLVPVTAQKNDKKYMFDKQAFLNSMQRDRLPYCRFLLRTQSGSEFIHQAELGSTFSVFDGVVESRRKRGFKGKLTPKAAPPTPLAQMVEYRTSEAPGYGSSENYVDAMNSLNQYVNGRFPSRLEEDIMCKFTM